MADNTLLGAALKNAVASGQYLQGAGKLEDDIQYYRDGLLGGIAFTGNLMEQLSRQSGVTPEISREQLYQLGQFLHASAEMVRIFNHTVETHEE